ncbi:MAG: hypothetical protein JXA46_06500 [Dehalococcoidales bacterium]|nr:hypothetical protein [Dehalococcoidales bacterium]
MYLVKCKLMKFDGDEEAFPCHFRYEIGDEIYYDGVKFTGRVCPHLIIPMMPVVYGVHCLGHKYSENIAFRYRGLDVRDPSMARYDGEGWRPRKSPPEALVQKTGGVLPLVSTTQKARGAHFCCSDNRTLAHFSCEPVDLSDSEFCQPFYRRAISILEKIEAEPGIALDDILKRFSDFEKEEISPPLTPVLTQVLLEVLSDMEYIRIEDCQARATGKQPPSRPRIG